MVQPGSRDDSCLDANHGVKGGFAAGWCPEPEVRTPLPRVRLRTSGSKGHQSHKSCSCPFDSEVRMRVCRKDLRTSESGHEREPLTPWSASKNLVAHGDPGLER